MRMRKKSFELRKPSLPLKHPQNRLETTPHNHRPKQQKHSTSRSRISRSPAFTRLIVYLCICETRRAYSGLFLFFLLLPYWYDGGKRLALRSENHDGEQPNYLAPSQFMSDATLVFARCERKATTSPIAGLPLSGVKG
jgi:hypothetical protein